MASYKDLNREVKGYVETIYKLDNIKPSLKLFYKKDGTEYDIINGSTIDVMTQTLYDLKLLYDTPRKAKEYTILYENYIKLNNDFTLFNMNFFADSFISNKVVFYYLDYLHSDCITLRIGNSTELFNKNISGISIYCGNNVITNYKCKLINNSNTVVEQIKKTNINNNFFVTFENDTTNCYVEFEFYSFLDKNKRLILNHIDIGLTAIYQNENLISFTVTEQVDKLLQDTPANELNVTIGDYEAIFNPLNPKGIYTYLNNETKFIPYIGILNDNGEIDYDKMGVFYYNNIEYSNKQITLNAYNLISKISKENIKCPALAGTSRDLFIAIGELPRYLNTYLGRFSYNYELNIDNENRMRHSFIDNSSLLKYLQNLIMDDGILYVDRDEKIICREVDKTIKDTISKSELKENLKYTKLDNSNSIKTTAYILTTNERTNTDTAIFSYSFTLKNSLEKVVIYSDDLNSFYPVMQSQISQTGATSVKLDYDFNTNFFFHFLFLEVQGEPGSEVTINITKTSQTMTSYALTKQERLIGNDNNTNIVIENPIMAFYENKANTTHNKFISKIPHYKAEISYNGNPKLKAGDYINAQSDYGYIPVFIQKHTLTFDGSLSGTIEGVE